MKQFRNEFKSQKVNYDRILGTINKDGNDVEEIKGNVGYSIYRNTGNIFMKEKKTYMTST